MLLASPDCSITTTMARTPSVTASCICAAVGAFRTSVTYRVLHVSHMTCSPTLFSGMIGIKNKVKNRRPVRCR